MNNIANNVFIFAAGVAIGSAVTWKIVKTKYEQIANEEIESVKERFRNRQMPVDDKTETDAENAKEPCNEYDKILDDNGYRNYSDTDKSKKEEKENMNGPYVISPDEFDENDYETESLTYYADGVLTDMYDNVISDDDIDYLIGKDSLNHFGEFEEDSVFVRNDENKTDYEILRDLDNYYDKHPEERQ